MIALSAIIYMNKKLILFTAVVLIVAHNLFDSVHVPGNGLLAIVWSFLHDVNQFTFGELDLYVRYPVLPWLGIMTLGYYLGFLYAPGYEQAKRRSTLLQLGIGMIVLFIVLRIYNFYGDAAQWSVQDNAVFSLLSILNVTKYPPSFHYTLITLGPALIFLALTEKPLQWTAKAVTFGRVPMFYYLAHLLLIHILAAIAALCTGYPEMMVLKKPIFETVELKGYGFNLGTVYIIWVAHILLLYPLCWWFDRYKRTNQRRYWWLSYL
jgi:uncharacterized membrane protein